MRIDYAAPKLADGSPEAAAKGVAIGVQIRNKIRQDISTDGTPLSFLAALPLSL